jgi:CubicO group peptidase (beta-lactamase class C family)
VAEEALRQIDGWPATAAAGVVTRQRGWAHGPRRQEFRWASVTKLLTAMATLVSGLPFEGERPIARPGQRRIYSNVGFDVLGSLVAERAEMTFEDYLRAAVLDPLEMNGTRLDGRPSAGLRGPLDDLLVFALELLEPRLVAGETLAEATTVAFPGLVGVIPDLGRFEPNDWGLGFELRDAKSPHWTGTRNSERTFGHFGGSGSFLWVDPAVGAACASLADLEFGDWAQDAWPRLSDAVLAELA